MTPTLISDITVAFLLIATIGYVAVLNRRLGLLRQDKAKLLPGQACEKGVLRNFDVPASNAAGKVRCGSGDQCICKFNHEP